MKKQGTHIAFTAGTGCLVFIDLVAFLLRANLKLVDAESIPILSKGSTFKLVLFVSFPNREDALALPLFEGLHQITQAKGLSNFSLHVRISSEQKQGRWDLDFIEQQLDKFSRKKKRDEELAKVYVCGPPPMNEVFDRALTGMVQRGELGRE